MEYRERSGHGYRCVHDALIRALVNKLYGKTYQTELKGGVFEAFSGAMQWPNAANGEWRVLNQL